ncbi:MAG: PilZ domain-containing protein [Deltaproteobacteria bacterium]|nr:PilZ domain-containing protein [Deltaproteobacteria bacterium]
MTTHDKRKKPRIDTHNLLSYVCLDENSQVLTQGMGRTLNVSEGGILLETHVPLDQEHIISLTISLEDEIMDIKGKITYHKKLEDGMFESGIRFIDMDETQRQIIKQYTIIFQGERDNLRES